MGAVDLLRFATGEELAEAAAADCLQACRAAESKSQRFFLALSGGRIAKVFFSALARRAKALPLALEPVHFFWSDERCVPPDNPESNFCLANELLLAPLKIPGSKVHRIQGEKSPEEAARAAEEEARNLVPLSPQHQPVFDLILLGMGEDGHVASLFPQESEAAAVNPAIFRHVIAVKPPPQRVTLGYSAIFCAKQVWVLASGAGKQAALTESLRPNGATPLGRVLRGRSSTRIFTDIELPDADAGKK